MFDWPPPERLYPTGESVPWGDRPLMRNNFGEYVTERSITQPGPFGGWMNFPTVWGGQFRGEDDSRARALQSGEFQYFRSLKEAAEAARRRSEMLSIMLRGLRR